jgi:hypothetical protein
MQIDLVLSAAFVALSAGALEMRALLAFAYGRHHHFAPQRGCCWRLQAVLGTARASHSNRSRKYQVPHCGGSFSAHKEVLGRAAMPHIPARSQE